MAEAIVPEELAARVRELVDRNDGGDVTRAAKRIGAREPDLRAILGAESGKPSLAALSPSCVPGRGQLVVDIRGARSG